MERVRLYAHQQAIIDRALLEKRLAVFADPGTGKTISMLEVFRRRPARTVVVGPKTVIRTAWAQDSERVGLEGVSVQIPDRLNRAERARLIQRESDSRSEPWMLCVGFEMFRTMLPEIEAFFRPERLIVDESSRLKNPTSQTSRALLKLADKCGEVFALSGTPAPNGPQEYWGQLRLIDKSIGGAASNGRYGSPPTFHSWAFRYLIPHRVLKPIRGGPRMVIDSWKIKPGDDFDRMLKSRAMVVRKQDCLDLPEKLDRTIRVDLSKSEWSAYIQLENDASVTLKGCGTHEFSVQAVSMKCRQVTGGSFLSEDGNAVDVGTSKIEALEDLIFDTLDGEPVVIWCEFKAEVSRISAMLDRHRRDHAIADGDHDSTVSVRQFVAGGVSVLIANTQSVGHGVTLVQCGERSCRHAVYFSLSWSSERHEQSRDRIHRIGQRCDVTYWHLVAKDSLDETIMGALSRKMSVQSAVLERLKHGSAHEGTGEVVHLDAVQS